MDLKKELQNRKLKVDEYLGNIFEPIKQNTLRKAIEHLPNAGGKRLRPICTMLACEMFGGNLDHCMPLAIGIELVHNFTLIHDDIMDEDSLRRGVPTVHEVFDTATAINAGDGLYSHAYMVLARTPCPDTLFRYLVEEVASTVRAIGEGQQDDIEFEEREHIGIAEYLDMIEKKTAKIFELACRGGALVAGADERTVGLMGEYGKYFGISFQVLDDYLDMMSTAQTLGKTIGTDLRKGKKTLVMVIGLEKASGTDHRIFREIWGNPDASQKDIETVKEILVRVGAIEEVKRLGVKYQEMAKNSLKNIPSSPQRDIFLAMADYNLTRKN